MQQDTPRRGLPGLAGLDHVGLTVPDLGAAIAFFVEVIGADFIYDGGAIGGRPEDEAFMVAALDVHPQARCRYAFLRCGNGLNLELFEYAAPDQDRTRPRNSDWGGHHIALYVDDIAAAVAHLRAHGIRVLGEPMAITEGNSAGASWVYFLSPWGLQMELCSAPHGKAYERTAAVRLWHPQRPAG